MVVQIAPAEQRIVLNNVSWETYERILADHENSSAPRFVYDRGMLEIMSPLPEHERMHLGLSSLVRVVAEILEIDYEELGSTTFRRADLDRGFEADACFYFQDVALIRSKDRIDLLVDPPPDLVIEIDITHSTLNKLAIYADFGVAEVWRYVGNELEIHVLNGEQYSRQTESSVLPGVTVETLSRFVADYKTSNRIAWLRQVRAWAATLPR